MPLQDSSSATQVCTKCGKERPLADYTVRKNGTPYRQCKRCAYERVLAWQAANPTRHEAWRYEYVRRPERQEKQREASREWDAKHPDRRKALNEAWRATPSGMRSNRATARRAFDRKRDWLDSFKVGKPCADCGGHFPPFVLDFDHVRGVKSFTVGNWIAGKVNASEAEVLAEITKCDLRCANCHRIRHADQLRPARNPSANWRGGQMAMDL